MKRSQRWFNDLFFRGEQEKSPKINKFYAKKLVQLADFQYIRV